MALILGSGSPLRTRRNNASDDGRVLVGSRPMRLYIVRTAATSAGALMRTAASAAANGASSRGSRSTTVASCSHRTPGRTMAAISDAMANGIGRRRIWFERPRNFLHEGSDDLADSLAERPG